MLLTFTVHPVHIRSLASMPLTFTVHPVHIRSLASMLLTFTVHPVHKKAPGEWLRQVLSISDKITALRSDVLNLQFCEKQHDLDDPSLLKCLLF